MNVTTDPSVFQAYSNVDIYFGACQEVQNYGTPFEAIHLLGQFSWEAVFFGRGRLV